MTLKFAENAPQICISRTARLKKKKKKEAKVKRTTFTHRLVQSALPLTVGKHAGLNGSPELVVVHMSRLNDC